MERENNYNPADQARGEALVPMQIEGLDSREGTEGGNIVVLLTPKEKGKYRMPNGNDFYFPVVLTPELAPLCLAKVKQVSSSEGLLPDMTNFFELISDTRLVALHICEGTSESIRNYLVYENAEGEQGRFPVLLDQGTLVAYEHCLAIMMEGKLLASFMDMLLNSHSFLNSETTKKYIYDEIKKSILSHEMPADEDELGFLSMGIDYLSNEEVEELVNLALENDAYEWVSHLTWVDDDYIDEEDDDDEED